MSERIRWQEAEHGNIIGYVSTPDDRLFRIQRPVLAGERWLLTTDLPVLVERVEPGAPDRLKAEAERWLEEFVSSLGAVFPEPGFEFEDDGEPLEVRWAAGRRVRYAHPNAGYPVEQLRAADCLTLGEVYTVGWADIGQSRTDLNLFSAKKPVGRFNSVFFEPADDEDRPVTPFTLHQDVAAVEHDDSTRQPREGGRVNAASVIQLGGIYVQVRYENGSKDAYYQESGWRAWDGEFRWRLVPVCRCEKPVLGEPVTAEDGSEFCGPDCLSTAGEASHGAMASRERD